MNEYYQEKYIKVKNNYINEFTDGQKHNSYSYLARLVIFDVINASKKQNIDPDLLEERLDKALELLSDLYYAASDNDNAYSKDQKEDFYNGFPYITTSLKEAFSTHFTLINRVDILAVNDTISKYMSYDWLSSPVLEWYIINSYLWYVTKMQIEQYIHNGSLIAIFVENLFKDEFSRLTAFYVGKLLCGCISVLTHILLALFAFDHDWNIIGFIIIVCLIVSLIRRILRISIRSIFKYKQLNKLIAIKNYVRNKVWSPSKLMGMAKSVDKYFYMPELVPLISKIKQRSNTCFNFNNNNPYKLENI